jgi:hypothetical protein
MFSDVPFHLLAEVREAWFANPMVVVDRDITPVQVFRCERQLASAELTMVVVPSLTIRLVRTEREYLPLQESLLALSTPVVGCW